MERVEEKSGNTIHRLAWVDILKGIGIIFVVLGHVYNNKVIFNWLYSFHMPLFFFISGWLYRKKAIYEDLKNRLKTIAIPYFTFGFIILIYWQFLERHFRYSNEKFITAFVGLLTGRYSMLDFNVHLWFLPCFFWTVMLFNIINNICGEKAIYGISIIMSAVFIFINIPEVIWNINLVFKYIGFYLIGYITKKKDISKFMKKREKKYNFLIAVLLLGLNFILAYYSLTNGIFWFITATIGISSIATISINIENNRILEYLGKISIVILCIHGPIYRVLVKIISLVMGYETAMVRQNLFLACITVAITLFICSIAYEIIIRFFPWMIGKK